jgi:hypothetical protein
MPLPQTRAQPEHKVDAFDFIEDLVEHLANWIHGRLRMDV